MARDMFKTPLCCGGGERAGAVHRLPVSVGGLIRGAIITLVLIRDLSCSAQKDIDVVRIVV
jgi:hypothetical protein